MESFLQTTSFGWAMQDKSSSLSLSGKHESLGYATYTPAFLMVPMHSFPVQSPAQELVRVWKTSSQLLILAFKALRTPWEALLPLSCVSVLSITGYHISTLCIWPKTSCCGVHSLYPVPSPDDTPPSLPYTPRASDTSQLSATGTAMC